MPIGYHELTQENLKERGLETMNALLRDIVQEVVRLAGFTGPVVAANDLDMNGHRITNLGAACVAGDAISQAEADSRYVGAKQLQKTIEATGKNILQTTRRLNDNTQRERSSTFLNETGVSLANSNNSTVTVVASGANSVVTLLAGTLKYGDDTPIPYPQRQDTVANPASGSDFYYYFYDVIRMSVGLLGPFTADNSFNRLGANRDGKTLLAAAQVNAAGGGSGGGGGGGTPPGCCEVGSKLVLPAGSESECMVEPCDKWVEIKLEDGTKLSVAMRTLVSTFACAEALNRGDLVEVENGKIQRVAWSRITERASHKVVMRVRPGQTYYANGVRLHNLKTL